MGFYLAIPYLFYRGRKKLIARSFLITGLLYGILIGIARMMAGGHFASDVVWAGGITWGVALAGYYFFSLGKPDKIETVSGEHQKKMAKRVTLISGILLPVITLGLMLATPYFSKKYLDVTNLQLKTISCKVVDLDLRDATVTISAGKEFHLDYNVNAFGFPNSKIRGKWILNDTSRYVLQYMGWFTEVKNSINIQIPLDDSLNWMIHVEHGKVICNLPERFTAFLHVSIQKGDLMIRSPSDSLKLIGNEAIVVKKKSGNPRYFMQNRFENAPNTISFDVHDGKVFIE
jgi:tetrahydromethanopterin S-methyltransferase subunit G